MKQNKSINHLIVSRETQLLMWKPSRKSSTFFSVIPLTTSCAWVSSTAQVSGSAKKKKKAEEEQCVACFVSNPEPFNTCVVLTRCHTMQKQRHRKGGAWLVPLVILNLSYPNPPLSPLSEVHTAASMCSMRYHFLLRQTKTVAEGRMVCSLFR